MLETVQIIAIIQGFFLLIILFKNRKKYIFTNYFYLNATLISLLFFLLGDDTSNLIVTNSDFFLVDNTLFITFLLLFLKDFKKPEPINLKILPYFIPALLYLFIEFYEIYYTENFLIEILEHILYFTFVIYLALSFNYALKIPTKITVKIPFLILILSLFVQYSLDIFTFISTIGIPDFMDSFLILEIALVFYYLTYLFIFSADFMNLPIDTSKYKNSSLNENDIQQHILTIKTTMEREKYFLNSELSLQSFSEKTSIPKHFISEILNIHLNITFTQFVNEYRIKEFIKLYTNNQNKQYSILGIANSVGFKNKATFNTAFKKITGTSPSEYKKEV